RAEGHYLYDREGTPYLDLQMWYSAASFGYGNRRLNGALKNQVNKLPQLACQYLHSEKVELAAAIGRLNESKFGLQGRVHFNVGGARSEERRVGKEGRGRVAAEAKRQKEQALQCSDRSE